jgi:hypothetical protein
MRNKHDLPLFVALSDGERVVMLGMQDTYGSRVHSELQQLLPHFGQLIHSIARDADSQRELVMPDCPGPASSGLALPATYRERNANSALRLSGGKAGEQLNDLSERLLVLR